MGDMPIYVGAQSADVWCFPDLFELGESGAPVVVSGVPPDAFSETGQLWGSPLYDWQVAASLCTSHLTRSSVNQICITAHELSGLRVLLAGSVI